MKVFSNVIRKVINSANWHTKVIDYEEELPEEFTMEDFMRKTLKQLHQLHKMKDRYYNLEDVGRIDKNQFF